MFPVRKALSRALLLLTLLVPAAPAAAAVHPASPAHGFTDSIGVNTHLSWPDSPYYNLNYTDQLNSNPNGASAYGEVKRLLQTLRIKHVRHDFCAPSLSVHCAKGNQLAAQLAADIPGLKFIDMYFGAGSTSTANLASPATIAAEVQSNLTGALPYAGIIEAFEGPNEFDVKKVGGAVIANWAGKAAQAQQAFLSAVATPAFSPLAGKTLLPASLGKAQTTAATQADWLGDTTFARYDAAPLGAANQHAYWYTACPEAAMAGADIMGAASCEDRQPASTCASGATPTKPTWLRCGDRQVGSSKPIWLTETGYTTSLDDPGKNGMSERAASIYLPRLLLEGWRRQQQEGRGLSRTYLYELIDSRQGNKCQPTNCLQDREAGHGLAKANYAAKLQLTALANLMQTLDDAPGSAAGSADFYLSQLDQRQVRRLLFRKADGTFVLALWRPVSVWKIPGDTGWPWYQLRRGSDIPAGTAPNLDHQVRLSFPKPTSLAVSRPSFSETASSASSYAHTITVRSDVTLISFR